METIYLLLGTALGTIAASIIMREELKDLIFREKHLNNISKNIEMQLKELHRLTEPESIDETPIIRDKK